MMLAKLMLGNCYSSTNNQELMMKNYMIAKRIAQAVGEKEWIQDIYYNIASTFYCY